MQLNIDPEKPRYQCFVCGFMFKEFEDYKRHIIEQHEEGRDYILCPLERCKCPIRDLRTHFKAKHPTEPIPQIGMSRALIWHDFKEGKKKKTNKPRFKEGYHYSPKMNKQMHYRSGYELKVYKCLDKDTDVASYDIEPFEVSYLFKGVARKYIPDIVVRFVDGHIELWEVKPAKQTILEINQNKWNAASRACRDRGWQFIVVTEVGIDKLVQKIRNQTLLED